MFDTLTETELIALLAKLDSGYENFRCALSGNEIDWKLATEINDICTMVAATLWTVQEGDARRLGVIV